MWNWVWRIRSIKIFGGANIQDAWEALTMLAQTYVSGSPRKSTHHKHPNQGFNMLLSPTIWSPFCYHQNLQEKTLQGRIKTFNAKHGFGTLAKGEFVVMKGCFCWAGIIKWDPIWWNQTWCKAWVVLRDFPLVHEVWLCFFQDALLNSALKKISMFPWVLLRILQA